MDEIPQPMGDFRLVRGLIYGDYGQGKTLTAGKICKALGGLTLSITADSCWSVLSGIDGLKVDRIPYVSRGSKENPVFKNNTFGMLYDVAETYGEATVYSNLLIDPTSTIVDNGRRHYTRVKKFEDQRDPDLSSWTHYGLTRDKFADAVDYLTTTKLNIFYVCHLRNPSDEETRKAKDFFRPLLPEKTYEVLARECNLIGLCYKDQIGSEYMITMEGTKKQSGKSQIPTVPQKKMHQDALPQLIVDWIKS